jgi:hypothetical protein
MQSKSFKEQRIRKLTQLYYSRKDIQKTIFNFCQERETVPRFMMTSFGKRPDSFQYQGDIFELVKKGATSFHCSEEIWKDPLQLSTGMSETQLNELRKGWDFLIDIDSKYLDYAKIMAELIIKVFRFHGIKNIGVKFSGSKGFHILIPWKAFPKRVGEIKISDMFPQWPRIILKYLSAQIREPLIDAISNFSKPSKYIKDFEAPKEVMPDLILVSPRHLFRTPYSLHEKTALASVVINPLEVKDFDIKDANPMKAKIRNFMPDSRENEAKELLTQALDWHKQIPKQTQERRTNFKPIKLDKLSDKNFPPCVKNILKGLADGQHRALFALINLFRSVGMDKDELEKRIYEWNKKNKPPIKQGYIKTQLDWNFKRKPLMPSNCKEFYQGIGVCDPDSFCKLIKNPVNYVIRKTLIENKASKTKKTLKTQKP